MKPLFLIIFIGVCFSVNGQQQIKIDSATYKQQSAFCIGHDREGRKWKFVLNKKGAGRFGDLMGLFVTYIPEGLPKRRNIHFKINN